MVKKQVTLDLDGGMVEMSISVFLLKQTENIVFI